MSYETRVDEEGRTEHVYVKEEPDDVPCPDSPSLDHFEHFHNGHKCCHCEDASIGQFLTHRDDHDDDEEPY